MGIAASLVAMLAFEGHANANMRTLAANVHDVNVCLDYDSLIHNNGSACPPTEEASLMGGHVIRQ